MRQATDYAWTKGVTWALLSDLEGLHVSNAEWKEDNPLRAQFIDFGVDTYLADFERLWWSAAGGPRFMSERDVARIHTRPDEHFRRLQLGLEGKK